MFLKLYVKNINYTEQWIDLYDPDDCIDPRQLRIPDLTSSPFDFWGMRNYTFFNCSTYKDSPTDHVTRIPCLSSTHHYQIAALWSDADAIYVPQSCRKMYDLEPVPFSLKYDDHDGKYISLLWNNPMCRTCYAFGQKCTRIGNTLETRCLLNISKHKTANASEFGVEPDDGCKETRCGDDGPTIQFPFWLKDQRPKHCGYPGFELYCTEDNHTMLELPHSGKFYVKDINYTGQGITLYDLDGCINLTMVRIPDLTSSPFEFDMHNYTFFNCSTHKDSLRDDVIGMRIPCLSSNHHYQITALMFDDEKAIYVSQSCRKMYNLEPVPFYWDYDDVKYISLLWHNPMCGICYALDQKCTRMGNTLETTCLDNISKNKTGVQEIQERRQGSPTKLIGSLLGSLTFLHVLVLYHVFRSNRLEKESQIKIEKFLQDYRALKPTRYTYADIQSITNQFKDKLGQGGYGTVFKGKLSNDVFVAVKILNNSKGNGEEFINEVGSMGRIHHVNVARLVGYCADGFRRALIYEYLPNKSLDKYIFSVNGKSHILGWEKLQDIALGIAKGIGYLHQGCDQQILHFDIKPQNILLDQNFNPKISDFGLAKLFSKEKSVVSMTAARGTMGYIAPEVLSRNFGTVSHKSDVFSFGMLLLEIVAGRKNIDTTVENTSQVYLPEWIHNQLDQGEDLGIQLEEERHAKIAKKLAIVGLWCIQWYPVNRPSMKVVVQMLEGEGDDLKIPPNPFESTHSMNQSLIVAGRRSHITLSVISESE
ncbi:rust resistance kinase Lr10-like [Quercus lobata]|uniref:rust resistance kinase Lr10-like n=1 Tax=Quercus lobata TaxID=97700 RepID=UPI0012486063|nr:rust resistance kinase Lr10-like [Quercus lobata]